MTKLDTFNKIQLKNIPEIRPGYTVRIHQKVKEGNKERIQIYEGLVIAAKHGRGISGTITVRKISNGIGVERIFPLHSPAIKKIEIAKKSKVKRAKLYYMRKRSGKSAKMRKKIEIPGSSEKLQQESQIEQIQQETESQS